MLRVALALLVAAAGACAEDGDWPQWRGPNREGATVGVVIPKTWPKSLKQLWEVKIGEGVSSPVVVSNRVYVHSRKREDEVVSCLSISDGSLIWSGNYPAPWKVQPGAGDDKGPHSTPTVKDGRVFTLGINGVLTCWDAATGAVNWRCTPPGRPAEIVPQYGAALSPLV